MKLGIGDPTDTVPFDVLDQMERFVSKQKGILAVKQSDRKSLSVEYDPDTTGPRLLIENLAMKYPEYPATLAASKPKEESAADSETKKWRMLFFFSLVLSVPVFFIAFISPSIPAGIHEGLHIFFQISFIFFWNFSYLI